jgi:hypothetical protein
MIGERSTRRPRTVRPIPSSTSISTTRFEALRLHFSHVCVIRSDMMWLHENGRAAESPDDSLRPALVVDRWFNWRYRSFSATGDLPNEKGRGQKASVCR